MRTQKKIIRALIFEKYYSGHMSGFPYKDLPKDLEPKDWIEFEGWDEEFRSDGGEQAGALVRIFRDRLETDEEFKKDVEFWSEKSAASKKERYNQYLKLKKEFEEPAEPKTTTIPEEKWGVHKNHCCFKDKWCKYGNKDCPVVIGLVEQEYKCEFCDDINE